MMKLSVIKTKLQDERYQGLQGCKVTEDDFTKNSYLDQVWKPWRSPTVLIVLTLTVLASLALIVVTNRNLCAEPRRETALPEQVKVISCYYNTPDRNSTSALLPSDIHPHLCTHINVAFARVVHKEIYLDESLCETLREVVKLKRGNPALRVLLSVGGAGGDDGFSKMVINHAARKVFIKSIKEVLRNYSLDGVDLDWEFPALHSRDYGAAARERQHFSQLLREIRMEYIREKRHYLLTVALAAPQVIVDVSYDVDQINLYVDYANVMTYDFHYYTKYTPFTGLNSPLYPRANEELYLATLNINYTIHLYLSKGLDKSKIVVGIPTYGHSFTLVNANNANVGSPASGYGALGGLGFVDYPAVCSFRDAPGGNVTEALDAGARVPYLYGGAEWVSFDSPRSVMEKADYVKAHELRGAMLYSLNADDFAGRCGARRGGGARFPLARSVRRVLRAPRDHDALYSR